tara:strand:- start:1003 stop:1218 length:216 start_codon:yes stop_codon:yes gene_type:complete
MIDTDKYERMLKDETYRLDGRNNMMALKLLAEVKRLKAKLFEAELWVCCNSYTFENNIKELNDYAEKEWSK